MMMPSLFKNGFDVLDSFYDPWFDNRQFRNLEKKAYGGKAYNIMSTDIKETENGYEMDIDLPGYSKDDIKIELEKGYLKVSAHKEFDSDKTEKAEGEKAEAKEEAKAPKFLCHERFIGSCERTYFVGDDVNEDDIKAGFKQGILTLSFPKKDPKELEQKKMIAIEG